MNRAAGLLEFYEDLDFEMYISLSDEICKVKGNLQDEMTNHARLYAYYAGVYEVARKDVEKQQNTLERLIDSARMNATEVLKSEGAKVTVAAVESLAMSDTKVHEAQDTLNKFKFKLGLLRQLTSSMSHKKDMLVQLSTHEREEKKLYN